MISENELKCVSLIVRSKGNKKSDIDPQVIGITESWVNKDTVDAELALTCNAMFRKDRQERRGGGVI